MAKLAFAALLEHPARMGMARLRASLSAIGGDGAIVRGGVDHRHNSAHAAENHVGVCARRRPWRLDPDRLHCTSWDPFHRADVACVRAVRRNAPAQEVWDIAKALDVLFGCGEGRLIARGVAEELSMTVQAIRAPGTTRKVVYMSGAPGKSDPQLRHLRCGHRCAPGVEEGQSLDAVP